MNKSLIALACVAVLAAVSQVAVAAPGGSGGGGGGGGAEAEAGAGATARHPVGVVAEADTAVLRVAAGTRGSLRRVVGTTATRRRAVVATTDVRGDPPGVATTVLREVATIAPRAGTTALIRAMATGVVGEGWGWGLGLGLGWGWGYPNSWAYPYSPTTLIVENDNTPLTFIEKEPEVAPAVQDLPPTHYWFYCTEPAGYYPYVQRCTLPWMMVLPQIPTDQPVAPRSRAMKAIVSRRILSGGLMAMAAMVVLGGCAVAPTTPTVMVLAWVPEESGPVSGRRLGLPAGGAELCGTDGASRQQPGRLQCGDRHGGWRCGRRACWGRVPTIPARSPPGARAPACWWAVLQRAGIRRSRRTACNSNSISPTCSACISAAIRCLVNRRTAVRPPGLRHPRRRRTIGRKRLLRRGTRRRPTRRRCIRRRILRRLSLRSPAMARRWRRTDADTRSGRGTAGAPSL